MTSKRGNRMSGEIISTSIVEKIYIDLCVKVASVFNSKMMKAPYYSWASNPMNDWFDRVFDLNIPP